MPRNRASPRPALPSDAANTTRSAPSPSRPELSALVRLALLPTPVRAKLTTLADLDAAIERAFPGAPPRVPGLDAAAPLPVAARSLEASSPEHALALFVRLQAAGSRKSAGSYFTPPEVARELARRALGPLRSLRKSKSTLVVDPSAGAGALLEAAGAFLPRATLLGADTDPDAALLARALLRDRLGRDSRVVWGDALATPALALAHPGGVLAPTLELEPASADAVIGNPPFVAHVRPGCRTSRPRAARSPRGALPRRRPGRGERLPPLPRARPRAGAPRRPDRPRPARHAAHQRALRARPPPAGGAHARPRGDRARLARLRHRGGARGLILVRAVVRDPRGVLFFASVYSRAALRSSAASRRATRRRRPETSSSARPSPSLAAPPTTRSRPGSAAPAARSRPSAGSATGSTRGRAPFASGSSRRASAPRARTSTPASRAATSRAGRSPRRACGSAPIQLSWCPSSSAAAPRSASPGSSTPRSS